MDTVIHTMLRRPVMCPPGRNLGHDHEICYFLILNQLKLSAFFVVEKATQYQRRNEIFKVVFESLQFQCGRESIS